MGIKIIAKNKRASRDYFLKDRLEAGIVLVGTEVKSLRGGKASLTDAYVTINAKGEAWVHNLHIAQYEFGNIANHEEKRDRKLLLHKQEINKLDNALKREALTLVPTMIYFQKSHVKLEIALAKGKKLHDKRDDLIQRDTERKLRKGDYE